MAAFSRAPDFGFAIAGAPEIRFAAASFRPAGDRSYPYKRRSSARAVRICATTRIRVEPFVPPPIPSIGPEWTTPERHSRIALIQ